MTKLKRHSDIIKKIHTTLRVEEKVAEAIIRHLLSFTAGRIRDKEETRAVRLPYWGVFDLIKGRKKK